LPELFVQFKSIKRSFNLIEIGALSNSPIIQSPPPHPLEQPLESDELSQLFDPPQPEEPLQPDEHFI